MPTLWPARSSIVSRGLFHATEWPETPAPTPPPQTSPHNKTPCARRAGQSAFIRRAAEKRCFQLTFPAARAPIRAATPIAGCDIVAGTFLSSFRRAEDASAENAYGEGHFRKAERKQKTEAAGTEAVEVFRGKGRLECC